LPFLSRLAPRGGIDARPPTQALTVGTAAAFVANDGKAFASFRRWPRRQCGPKRRADRPAHQHSLIDTRLKRDDFSSIRHPALGYWRSMIFFRKPVSTFRDPALVERIADAPAKVANLDAQAAGPRAGCLLNHSIRAMHAPGLEIRTRRVIPVASEVSKRFVSLHSVFGCRLVRWLVKSGFCVHH
jgi:hypothetical protein